jgi:hypothetical protein
MKPALVVPDQVILPRVTKATTARITATTRKITAKSLDKPATPPKPSTLAMSAMTANIMAQRNMIPLHNSVLCDLNIDSYGKAAVGMLLGFAAICCVLYLKKLTPHATYLSFIFKNQIIKLYAASGAL